MFRLSGPKLGIFDCARLMSLVAQNRNIAKNGSCEVATWVVRSRNMGRKKPQHSSRKVKKLITGPKKELTFS